MSGLTFAEYLDRRRSTYTQEWGLLQELKKDSAFREATSWDGIEAYLNARDAAFGLRKCAREAWESYRTAKLKKQGSKS